MGVGDDIHCMSRLFVHWFDLSLRYPYFISILVKKDVLALFNTTEGILDSLWDGNVHLTGNLGNAQKF